MINQSDARTNLLPKHRVNLESIVMKASMLVLLVMFAVTPSFAADPLPNWEDLDSKKAIIEFVEGVTDENSDNFVPVADRIATFDNDGTLWCEKPLYIHLMANFARFQEQINAHPELADKQPYHAVITKDKSFFMDLLEKNQIDTIISDLFAVPFAGATTEEYEIWQRGFLAKWKHPKFQNGYKQLTYLPMVELVKYLRANEFQVYACSADEGAFLKLVAEELYGIPPQRVLGTSVKLEWKSPNLVRTDQSNYLNNWDGKPRLIYQTIGKRPIFAAGNSNGDFEMLQYVATGEGPRMAVVVHHTDSDREYAYDSHTEKVIPGLDQPNWKIIDMKSDWKTVFTK